MQEYTRTYMITSEFWNCFNNLPVAVQNHHKRKFELFKQNPRHPSLELEKLGIGNWRVKVGDGNRALAIEDEEGLCWFWIGDHKSYDRLIG